MQRIVLFYISKANIKNRTQVYSNVKMINETSRHKGLRKRLVEGLKVKGIRNPSVLEAIGNVPRHLFMDSGFINFAYKDQAFPIGAGQTISQPYTVGFQTQLLDVQKGEKFWKLEPDRATRLLFWLKWEQRSLPLNDKRVIHQNT